MEIQTFMLCQGLQQVKETKVFNAQTIGIHNFVSLDGVFPIVFQMPYYMLLRREEQGTLQNILMEFNLIDSDGKFVGEPNHHGVKSEFRPGHKFMVVVGKLQFRFPWAGDFRLDIMIDMGERLSTSVFQYNIEIMDNKEKIIVPRRGG
jgi:hypothetical protein